MCGVNFAKKTKAQKTRKLPPREYFHVYSTLLYLRKDSRIALVDEKPLKHTIDFILYDLITNDHRNFMCAYNDQVNIQY